MMFQNLITMLANTVSSMANNRRLCSRDACDSRTVVWIAEDNHSPVSPQNESKTREKRSYRSWPPAAVEAFNIFVALCTSCPPWLYHWPRLSSSDICFWLDWRVLPSICWRSRPHQREILAHWQGSRFLARHVCPFLPRLRGLQNVALFCGLWNWILMVL